MNKKVLLGALCLAVVALAALTVHRQWRAKALAAEAEEIAARERAAAAGAQQSSPGGTPSKAAERTPTAAPAVTDEERAAYEQQITQLQKQLEAATTGQEQADDDAKQKPAAEAPMGNLAEMLKAPGMKDAMRAQQKGTLDLTYASLYSYLKLPPQKLEALKGLLLDRQMAFMDIGLDVMNASLSAEEKQAKAEAAERLKKEYDAKLHELLGEENVELFERYEETQPERSQLLFFKQALAGTEPLTEEQEHDLITAMHEERVNYSFSTGSESPSGGGADVSTEEGIARHMEDLAGLQERYAARAAEVLTETQLEQFRASQERQRSMHEMGLRMASRMLSTPPPEE